MKDVGGEVGCINGSYNCGESDLFWPVRSNLLNRTTQHLPIHLSTQGAGSGYLNSNLLMQLHAPE
jgi:hypothetical protein